ncbi:type VI secretion system baseplate subunit TssE [Roseomonas chloroacetimidivorans]|jgi:type VI secretion system protein ImpF|uniref:type VI secretion system baseplate subunit TssE n=1 Tax=Roseomonas chloroacetimidivorans TaxID=1766656 RepID=UPI003C7506CB
MSDQRGGMRVRLPLLDRLLDEAPETVRDTPPTATQAMEVLRASVRRDLEALLNARRRRWLLPENMPALTRSPLGYGIPDATSGSYAQEEAREALAREVEAVIRRFEPRLTNVSVNLRPANELDRTLRLRVTALLRTDPVPEPISFDTMLESVSHEVRVTER